MKTVILTEILKTASYSFMAPDTNRENGIDYFYLCGYVESLMPDQIHRGFGKHSLLGDIKMQRSDIMLFKDLNVTNLSRNLAQESALVSKYDIVRVLSAAKRPYATQVAKMYGVEDCYVNDPIHAGQKIGPYTMGMPNVPCIENGVIAEIRTPAVTSVTVQKDSVISTDSAKTIDTLLTK